MNECFEDINDVKLFAINNAISESKDNKRVKPMEEQKSRTTTTAMSGTSEELADSAADTGLDPKARRGRPRRPMAQRSVHELVLNLTQNQNSEKKSQNLLKESKKMSKSPNNANTNTTSGDDTTQTTTTTTTTSAADCATTTTTGEQQPEQQNRTRTGAVGECVASTKFTIGQKVEARDVVGDWYSAKIVAFSADNARVLVHFERWSARYDQWFDCDSDLIREKTMTTDSGNGESGGGEAEFALQEEVLARWTDNRVYPATIVELFAAQKCVSVVFFDGYRKKVRTTQIEKMPKHFDGLRAPNNNTGAAEQAAAAAAVHQKQCALSSMPVSALPTARAGEHQHQQQHQGHLVPSKSEFWTVADDHNEYKCHFQDCNKGFRKQSTLTSHLKHYHKSDDKKSTKQTPTTMAAPAPVSAPSAPPSACTPVVTSPVEPQPQSKSRLKRKYVRKAVPALAVRKSNRQHQHIPESLCSSEQATPSSTTAPIAAITAVNAMSSSSLVTTLGVKETPVVTPNTTLPFWDARTLAEIHESDSIDELVHCVCDVREESGLMVQCELCLCWQHAHCMHFDAELDVPKTGYFCFSCRFPKRVRKSRQNCFPINHALKYAKRTQFAFRRQSDITGQHLDDELTRLDSTANRRQAMASSSLSSDDMQTRDPEKELLIATHALLSATLDSQQVLTSLTAKLETNEGRDDERTEEELKERQKQVLENLAEIEAKVSKVENSLNDSQTTTALSSGDCDNDCELKRQLFLLFKDLKTAKRIAVQY